MEFLGIWANSENMTLSLSAEKLENLKTLCCEWCEKSFCTKVELQSLIGVLSFAAGVVRPGRIFFSRALNFLREMTNLQQDEGMDIPESVQKDIEWWVKFAPTFNGVSIIPPLEWERPDSVFSTDASLQKIGGFNFVNGQYFKCDIPERVIECAKHINGFEIYAIMIACRLWGSSLTGKNLLLYCDNASTVDVVNRHVTRDNFMQDCLRDIYYEAAQNQFQIKVVFIPTAENRISDSLTRWDMGEHYRNVFYECTSQFDIKEVHVTPEIADLTDRWGSSQTVEHLCGK